MAGLAQRRTISGGEEPARPTSDVQEDRLTSTILLVLAVATAAAALLISARTGLGVTPDSVNYLAAAESLASGDGVRGSDGQPLASFPPLLPVVLAALSAGPGDAVEAARWLHAVCFGATAFLAGWAVWRAAGSRAGAVVATAATALLRPGLDAALHVWSEPLFTALAMLALVLALRRVARPDDERILWAACAVAGLASLTRYIGVAVVLAVALTPLLDRPLRPRAVLRGLVAGSAGLAPFVLWNLRNVVRTGTLAGERYASADTFRDVVHATATALARPFAPPGSSASSSALALVGLVGALLVLALWRWLVAKDARVERAVRRLGPFALFTALYPSYLVMASTRTALDPIDDRLVAPALPALVVMLVGLITILVRGAAGRTALVVALAFWLLAPAAVTARYLERIDAQGIGGYRAARWRDSPLLSALRATPDDAVLYSNDPFAVRHVTGRAARLSPRRHPYRSPASRVDDLAELRRAVAGGREVRLIWFEGVPRDFVLRLNELTPAVGLEPEIEAADGTVYRITRFE